MNGILEREKTSVETRKYTAQMLADNALTGGHVRNARRESVCFEIVTSDVKGECQKPGKRAVRKRIQELTGG